MKILKITIVRDLSDEFLIEVDLPSGCYPHNDNMTLHTRVATGSGESYCERYFPGIPVKIIDLRINETRNYKFGSKS